MSMLVHTSVVIRPISTAFLTFVILHIFFISSRGLHDIPQDLRFVITGAINTVGLILTLWIATVSFKHLYSASTIYTYVNLLYIPVGHAMSSLIVFGWPRQYVKNLLLNAPIGLTATALGSYITGYLEIIAFDTLCYEFLEDWNILENSGEGGSLFSSVLVMIITGIWGYLLSNFVNSGPKTKAGDKGVKDL